MQASMNRPCDNESARRGESFEPSRSARHTLSGLSSQAARGMRRIGQRRRGAVVVDTVSVLEPQPTLRERNRATSAPPMRDLTRCACVSCCFMSLRPDEQCRMLPQMGVPLAFVGARRDG